MEHYSFIDYGNRDFLRYENGDVIIIEAEIVEHALVWLSEEGEKHGGEQNDRP